MEDKTPETLDGYTIEEWRKKYQIASEDANKYARIAGTRLGEINDWAKAAVYICTECDIECGVGVPFAEVVIKAFRALRAAQQPLAADLPSCVG